MLLGFWGFGVLGTQRSGRYFQVSGFRFLVSGFVVLYRVVSHTALKERAQSLHVQRI